MASDVLNALREGILAVTSATATLVVTGALLVVTMFATRNKCLTSSNKNNLITIITISYNYCNY